MCIILNTDNHKYLISRENWFDEFIYINTDVDFDSIYPVERNKEIWDSDIEKISIERSIIKI